MIMDKTKLIERLEIKLKTYTNEFEVLQNDSQIRNIAFGSAGYLSKGSKNKLYKHREKLGTITDKIELTKFCLKIVKGESFNLNDLHKLTISFVADMYKEYESVFYDPCFPVIKVKEIVHIIFNRYSLPYKKDIISCGLNYENTHGAKLIINLGDWFAK